MTCTWYITDRAVREYAALRGVELPESGKAWSGEAWTYYRKDLSEIAEVASARSQEDGRAPKRTASGLLKYRFRSNRLRIDIQLLVNGRPRWGNRPQLVSVVAGFRG